MKCLLDSFKRKQRKTVAVVGISPEEVGIIMQRSVKSGS